MSRGINIIYYPFITNLSVIIILLINKLHSLVHIRIQTHTYTHTHTHTHKHTYAHIYTYLHHLISLIYLVAGASSVGIPREVALRCRRVITMLPTSANVSAVYDGSDGLIAGLGDDSLCVDSSTIDQSVARTVAGAVADRGAMFVDAPVSGGLFILC